MEASIWWNFGVDQKFNWFPESVKYIVRVRLCVSACPVECEAYSSGVANIPGRPDSIIYN